MKIKIFKNKKKFKKGGFHANPNIGWEIILYITLCLAAFALVSGAYLFMRTNREPLAPVVGSGSHIKIVKKDRIGKVLQYFSLREKKSAEILKSPPPFIDPSL
jgi:hypothetical protein